MAEANRISVLEQARTVVVKIGTNVLADDAGRLDLARIQSLADQLYRVKQSGRRLVLVSSGAIGAGVGRLGLGERPTDLRHLQACAAIGQSFLMRAYQESFDRFGLLAAQILLTAGDFDQRGRYLNVRNTIHTLFEWGVLPIINENDTVSVAEIKFGDNDHLAAMVANLLQAPLLILLTNVDGLFAGDPSDPNAKKLDTIAKIDAEVMAMAGVSKSAMGTGGMRSKLRAARLATAAGESVIMANGAAPSVLDRIFQGENLGTLFLPHGESLSAWKRWLGYTARPSGKLHVDAGAVRAIQERGRSLLPIGVVQVNGRFHKGDVVAIIGPDGVEFARGLTNFSSEDAEKILGLQTARIPEVLGGYPYEEIVHRDNLVVIV